jgi:flavorubredoxin
VFLLSLRWGTGFLFEVTTKTLFAGDLFTQHGQLPKEVQEAGEVKQLE